MRVPESIVQWGMYAVTSYGMKYLDFNRIFSPCNVEFIVCCLLRGSESDIPLECREQMAHSKLSRTTLHPIFVASLCSAGALLHREVNHPHLTAWKASLIFSCVIAAAYCGQLDEPNFWIWFGSGLQVVATGAIVQFCSHLDRRYNQ